MFSDLVSIYRDFDVPNDDRVRKLLTYLHYHQSRRSLGGPKFFAGVGTRKIFIDKRREIQSKVTAVCKLLVENGYHLRTGDASGMDEMLLQTFSSLGGHSEIYNAADAKLHGDRQMLAKVMKFFHPVGNKITNQRVQNLLIRNLFQVVGPIPSLRNAVMGDFNAIRFGLCYTEDGCEHHKHRSRRTGGTGQFITYTSFFNIPVLNLANYTEGVLLEKVEILIKRNNGECAEVK